MSGPSLVCLLIGGIEIHVVGTQLRADNYFTDKKCIAPLSKQRGNIKYFVKIIEPDYRSSRLTSAEIFADFRKQLDEAIERTPRLQKGFINLEVFDRCSPLIDWRADIFAGIVLKSRQHH